MERTMMERVKAAGIERAIKMLNDDPDTNIPKLLDWVKKFDKDGNVSGQIRVFDEIVKNPDNNWYRLIKSLWTDIDDEVRATFFTNFILNATIIGGGRLDKFKKENDCNAPWAILMDPTSACNLHCTGCWAAEYGDRLNMSYETLDSIIRQGKAMGTHMYIYSGGEPLVRKADIIKLCEAHPECEFLAFTNGTLIDEAFADEMLRVKNFIPAISIEGSETETDSRRGAGTYQKVIRAMEILKKKKLPFGASLCYTSLNYETIGSDEYFDFLIDQGCKFAWMFTYMPVGVGAPTDLIAPPEAREYMYHRIREMRSTKEIFTLDFWNDGEYIKGCIAGARYYLHINANGDIEPCAFIHYSDSNIHEKTLLEAYKSPLFQAYRQGQPFNENHLRPCPLLDNKGALADMVKQSGAHSTDLQAPENVDDLTAKCATAADRWEPVADHLWQCSHGCAGCAQAEESVAAQ